MNPVINQNLSKLIKGRGWDISEGTVVAETYVMKRQHLVREPPRVRYKYKPLRIRTMHHKNRLKRGNVLLNLAFGTTAVIKSAA